MFVVEVYVFKTNELINQTNQVLQLVNVLLYTTTQKVLKKKATWRLRSNPTYLYLSFLHCQSLHTYHCLVYH